MSPQVARFGRCSVDAGTRQIGLADFVNRLRGG
jgi:hypothetical protein